MIFTQKVYFNNKPLILTNDRTEYIQKNPIADGYLKLTGAYAMNCRIAFEHLGKITSLGARIDDS